MEFIEIGRVNATAFMQGGKELGVQMTMRAAEIAFLKFLKQNLRAINPENPGQFINDSKRAFMTDLKEFCKEGS